jgi:hypothetical protein
MLDYFTVNGARISGADFALMGNVTVSAVFRELKQATLNIENTDSKPYTISIRKTGLMLQGGFMVNVTDASVSSGDTIYEGDVLTITAALKAGATPTDTNLVYSGQFTGSIAFGNVPVSWNASPFTVNATHLANAELGNGTAAVSAAPSTVAKDWLQVADVSWFDAASPQSSYTINSAAQLAGVAKIVNEGTHNFAGVTLTLAGNISLVNTDGTNGTRLWVPIGSATRSFTGIFDGSGREISGMSVVRTSGMYAGFFGNIEDATVLNLTVAGTVTSYQYGAGVVGYAKNSWIAGCINKASILAASSYTGGVVGALSASTALNCANEGTLGPTSSSVTLQYIGGVVGSADTGSVVRGCANKATVTGGYRVGGVVGNLASASAVTESSNTAAVVAEKSNSSNGVGGIVGNTAAGTQITKSFNSGSVSSAGGSNATYVGGLVGYMTSTALEDSYNRGAVTAIAGSVGGVVGRLSATASSASSIRRVYTTGTVTKGSLGNAGAITGYVNAAYNSYDKVYYLTGVLASGDVANGYLNNVGSSSISALAQSQTALKALTSTLGTAFKAGTASLNDGYPALVWQEPSGSSAGAPGSGDLNGDKTSTTQEAMTAARAAMGLLTLTPAQRVAMDMNGDGSLTMQDATRALRRSLGL